MGSTTVERADSFYLPVTEAQVVRSGRRIELVEAKLWANGRLAVSATAWRIRRASGSLPIQRLAVVADSVNGLSAELPLSDWTFIPPTMTLTLGRAPAGEWINIVARTVISAGGTAVASGDLHDREGFVGTVSQPLLVRPRRLRD
ncbi:acyl-CoA thioesterase domain-containing protein [Georgenia sp. SYP-B2076]|uniref:acyl-CoA thioesterase domain-containing protein n=1 Tax=Georgenia sp. SYP-B2076 TaxID=2495881 RepID=UPI000F8CDF16|nr:acyl-CoA thioesterase domain-containing protein [Georgenia sp. SYP-B2076]